MTTRKTDDTIREFIFGHGLEGSRQAYFDPKRVEAIQQGYLKGEWSRGEATRVEALEKEVQKLRSFFNDIQSIRNADIKTVNGTIEIEAFPTPLNDEKPSDRKGPELIKIDKHDVDKYLELRKKGYKKDFENDKVLVMIKE